jgi:hypothetical protein
MKIYKQKNLWIADCKMADGSRVQFASTKSFFDVFMLALRATSWEK